MKTIKKYTVGLFAVAVVLLSGCTNEMDEVVMQDGNIRITSLDINTDGVLTRAADANGYEGMVKTTWAANDEIALKVGNFTGKAVYYYTDQNNNGWKIYDSEDQEVSEIVISEKEYESGFALEARYTGQGTTDAEIDVLLVEGTYRQAGKEMNSGNADLLTASGKLNLLLAHAKSYIAVNLNNGIEGEQVQGLQVVLRDADGTTIATPVAMKANGEMTFFECFAEAAYIEKFVAIMLRSDNTTYEIPVIPTYGADNKGFAVKANTRYPFKITLTPSNQTRSFGSDAKGYGVITFQGR